MRLLVLNGPNLNLLGKREPDTYGVATLGDLEARLRRLFPSHEFDFFQSNVEGELIDRLHAADGDVDGVVFNPGGYSHTSVALRDAIAAVDVPIVEVHISNVAARESFRHHSLTAAACIGQIAGFGSDSYRLGVLALERRLKRPDDE
jgi:3-dehydroquinate dehydratase-2